MLLWAPKLAIGAVQFHTVTSEPWAVTAEAAGSSPVVPAIPFKFNLIDFSRDASGVVQTETLHAPALDSREAHITTSAKTDSLKRGKCLVTIPYATGLRLTVS